ncbi:IS4 family transposase [Botrimarina mediterranea]|uniref:Transposase DDE domain protein n=1 Tax=Botrimarina mediterranea TaxID=2528022 RepID=A0A518K781_9BACT|nr:IS4 family transposase [Botrimarina mediterranea]QDV73645.1 Transposase DDE domain protein [Botrimarina mediterranea]QDV78235.1 Transposase DDE domain protein [Planctomycetes bacterium K2D]
MRSITDGRCRSQISFLRRQFLQDDGLPFGDVLSAATLSRALATLEGGWVDRIYTPLTTLWVFLGQVLSADHSCRAAVARLIAHRTAQGQSRCSAETGAYCQARKRLPEAFFAEAARESGRSLDSRAKKEWLWMGRRVYIYDGSTVQMADTPENQAAYPQVSNQQPGIGFPIARIAAVFSLSCGAILDVGVCRYAGKGQSELRLLLNMLDVFCSDSVVLGDRLMCSWNNFVLLQQRGVDAVFHFTVHRATDFRLGERLGPSDHVVAWPRPSSNRLFPWKQFMAMPDSIRVRECRVRIARPGFRSKVLVLATTLLDAKRYPKEALAELYRARWNAELDLRSVKTTLQMDVLRCKTPELVRKEIWTHVLAYNLIRTVMAQAAIRHGAQPRIISFKGAVQTLEAFQPLFAACRSCRRQLYDELLAAVAAHRVGDRPDRYEPRHLKRRKKRYDLLTRPRHVLKSLMAKGVIVN